MRAGILTNLSKRRPSNIDTDANEHHSLVTEGIDQPSSIIRALAAIQRLSASPFRRNFSFSNGSFPNPTPAQEWIVCPPMFKPAIPVGAVIPISIPCTERKWWIIARSSTDFPVPANDGECAYPHIQFSNVASPAGPVKKIFRPDLTNFRIFLCSSESSMDGSATGRVGGTSFTSTRSLETSCIWLCLGKPLSGNACWGALNVAVDVEDVTDPALMLRLMSSGPM